MKSKALFVGILKMPQSRLRAFKLHPSHPGEEKYLFFLFQLLCPARKEKYHFQRIVFAPRKAFYDEHNQSLKC